MKNRIKVFRAMHDLTQEELAGKLGVTRQTIVSLEIGRYDPSIGLAFRIARLFNVKIEDVFEYEGDSGQFHGLPPVSRLGNDSL
jgi:putative transcriptional regulator